MLDLVKMSTASVVGRAKRVISQIKSSVQLESLILAQNERWRQA